MRLDDKELRAMEYVAKSRNCKTWIGIFEKVIADCVDIRNIEGENLEVELKARRKAVEILEKEFVVKLKVLSGNAESSEDSFE